MSKSVKLAQKTITKIDKYFENKHQQDSPGIKRTERRDNSNK